MRVFLHFLSPISHQVVSNFEFPGVKGDSETKIDNFMAHTIGA